MQDIFNQNTIEGLKVRVKELDANSQAQWGKMSIYQMLKHCSENEKMMLREKTFRRLFIGRIFGKMALKANIKDDKPLSKNDPTHPDLRIKGNGDIEAQKGQWLRLLDQYPHKDMQDYQDFIHPFFGKMNREQVSKFAYKHIDHHLRQFGV